MDVTLICEPKGTLINRLMWIIILRLIGARLLFARGKATEEALKFVGSLYIGVFLINSFRGPNLSTNKLVPVGHNSFKGVQIYHGLSGIFVPEGP